MPASIYQWQPVAWRIIWFRGDDPAVARMSWATYGTWVYRVELPPRPEQSVRAALPRFVDVPFDTSHKLHGSHVQRLRYGTQSTNAWGLTRMPELVIDSEFRNAMYKQKEPGMMYFPTKWGAKEPQNPQNHRVAHPKKSLQTLFMLSRWILTKLTRDFSFEKSLRMADFWRILRDEV